MDYCVFFLKVQNLQALPCQRWAAIGRSENDQPIGMVPVRWDLLQEWAELLHPRDGKGCWKGGTIWINTRFQGICICILCIYTLNQGNQKLGTLKFPTGDLQIWLSVVEEYRNKISRKNKFSWNTLYVNMNTLFSSMGDAPYLRSSLITSTWPPSVAMWRGVESVILFLTKRVELENYNVRFEPGGGSTIENVLHLNTSKWLSV